ncbi:hypothetical protein [Evansella tamaricis]|uniref:Uncharacterized protein n=1 Tax=Evansella tamaricis TaxID=2069301 RepID=A0ABS6JFN6_9BACI|nr:hypothetical protein [Evansella tamaricis]MBU9711143.1 hypothetical protein [Evansella tamaricis]
MNLFTTKEVTKFFQSYDVKCDEKLVEEWMNSLPARKNPSATVSEGDLYQFDGWYRLKGTAYEEGIDDQTKIARLLEEIDELKGKLKEVQREKNDLEDKLGIMPF